MFKLLAIDVRGPNPVYNYGGFASYLPLHELRDTEEENMRILDIDKSAWPRGEWDTEPDRVDFVHTTENGQKYSCMVIRNRIGALCGYVGIPSSHILYGKNYNDIDYFNVHGGLTYTDKCDEGGDICHVPEPGMPKDVWWLGFDTLHYMDLTPGMKSILSYEDIETYKNMAYVISECRSLAEQLSIVKETVVKETNNEGNKI